jgi:hypothetical protein
MAAQEKPLQIVRPTKGGTAHQGGVPWMDDSTKPGGFWTASTSERQLSPKQSLAQGAGADSNNLRVSGWWTIDVKNLDGSMAVHREAENYYDTTPFLVYLLAGKLVPGEVMINFVTNGSDSSAGSPCLGTNGCQLSETPGGLWASQPNCVQNPGSCSTNLTPSISTVTVPIDYDCAVLVSCLTANETVSSFELNGSITSQVSNNIGHLESYFFTCSESAQTATSPVTALNPASCISARQGNLSANAQAYRMTLLDLGSPIRVSAGQVVSIKLDLSFVALPDQHCSTPDGCS